MPNQNTPFSKPLHVGLKIQDQYYMFVRGNKLDKPGT